MTSEYRTVELRAEGRTLSGPIIVYGDTATIGGRPERFAPRAFAGVETADLLLNVQHRRDRPLARTGGGGLELRESDRGVELRAELPETREAGDALALVSSGVLRGLSAEFVALSEHRDGPTRVLDRAELRGVALVDRPAYASSLVELRQDGQGIEGRIYYDRLQVIDHRAAHAGPVEIRRRGGRSFGGGRVGRGGRVSRGRNIRKRTIRRNAFRFTLADANREVNLLAGRSYSQPLASRRAGSLELEDTDDALVFRSARLPDTSWARDLRGAVESGAGTLHAEALYRIPPARALSGPATRVIAEPGRTDSAIEVVEQANLTAIALVLREPRTDGEPLSSVELRELVPVEPCERRRRWW